MKDDEIHYIVNFDLVMSLLLDNINSSWLYRHEEIHGNKYIKNQSEIWQRCWSAEQLPVELTLSHCSYNVHSHCSFTGTFSIKKCLMEGKEVGKMQK